jgi:hypothetical protein
MSSVNEKVSLLAIQHLTGKKFVKTRPSWLSLGSSRLELDGYNQDLNIAFEYNGRQHYFFIPYFHDSLSGFFKQIVHDKYKSKICSEHGIHLISIPYHINTVDICDYLYDSLNREEVLLKNTPDSFDLEDVIETNIKHEDLLELIEEKDGELVSGVYVTGKSGITIQCEFGHVWSTKARNLLTRNFWCNICGRINVGAQNSIRYKGLPSSYKHTKETTDKMVRTKLKKRSEFRQTLQKTDIFTCLGPYCIEKLQPKSNFNKKSDSMSGYQSWCNYCIQQAKKKSREKAKESVFKCDKCPKQYQLKDSLTRHIKEKHKLNSDK